MWKEEERHILPNVLHMKREQRKSLQKLANNLP